MSRILRFFVCLGTLFFASNALAAGYSCSSLPKYLSCQHGYYMTSSQSSTTYNGTPKVGNYCQPCSRMGSNYTCAGGTAAPVQSAGGYTCPTYKKYTSCSTGYYMTDSSTSTTYNGSPKAGNACRPCSVYGANYTCAGGTAAPQAIKINVTCPKGQYLPSGATSCTTCPAGSYCPGQTCSGVSLVSGATSACGITSCRTATSYYFESAAGSSNINNCYLTLSVAEKVETVNNGLDYCTSGEYCDNDGRKVYYDEYNEERDLTDSRPTIARGTACARGSYSDDEATACEPCPKGNTTSGTGSGSCGVTCSNSANVKTWVEPTWTPNYVSNLCKIDSCVACTKGTGVASCSASVVNNACTYTATCASGYKNPTCNGSSCSCELDSVTCSAGQYLPAGATSCATCPKGYKCPSSSKTYTVSTTADQGNTPCSGATEYQDATGQTSCKTPSDGYYKKDNTSQQVCGTGYFCKSGVRTACTTYGTGYTTDTTTASVNTQCYLNVAGGKVRNGTTGTTLNTCAAGKYKVAHKAYYGTSYSCDSCPAVESGWTMGTDTGLTNYTACYETKAATSISNYCSAGQLKKNGTSTTTWGTATISTAFQAKGGSIVKGQTCEQCGAGTYSAGGTATSCSTCDTAYPYSDAGTSSAGSCYKNGTKTGSQLNGSTPTNCYSVTSWNSCTPGTCTYRIYKSGTTTSCTPTNCTKTPAAVTAKSGYRTNGTSCTACPSGYPNSADGNSGGITACYSNSKSRAWTGSQVNGSTPTNCYSVTSWNACSLPACSYVAYSNSSGNGDGTIKSGCSTNSANCTKTPAAVTAKSGYYVSGTSCTPCSGLASGMYPNSDNGNTGGASACRTDSLSGQVIATANASSATQCAAGTFKAAHTVNYGSTSSCSACIGRTKYSAANASECSTVSTGYYTTGCNSSNNNCTGQSQCTSGTWCASGVQNQCSSLTGVSVSGGTYTSAAGSSANTACKYTAPSKTITGCKTVTTNTVTYSGTAWPATTYGVTANGGYIISGNNTAAATCSQCSGAVWSAGGTATSCSACPAQTSGWTRNSGTGWTAVTQCNQTKSVGGNCSAGVLKQNATSATAWGTTTISTPLQAKPGYIVSGQTCTGCVAGTYSAGGTATSCSACTGRTKYSAANASECSTVSTGYYTTGCNSSNNNCTGQSQCTSGTWCASGVQNQCSSLSGVSVTGGTYTSAAGSSANTACKYTAPSKTITGCKTVTTNTVTYSGTAWPTTTYGVTANGGYIISGNNTAAATCSQCGTAKYSAGGTATSCSSCPNADSGWTATSPAGSTAYTACYEYQTPVNCASGSVKRAASSATAYSSTISLLSTLKSKAGYYASTTATSCTICPAGSSCAASATAPTTCANWTYAASTGMSSCTACPALTSGWTKADSTGTGWKSHTNCVQISPKPANCAGGNLKQVAASNGATTWGASTVNSALSSNPGYYINGTACSACTGATYYGGGIATSCTPCPSIYTSDTTAAKSKAEQCAVQTTAGKYIATAKATEQTKCPAKNYCPSASVKYGATNSPTACPTADATTARTTYPDDYLNPTRLSINNQGWSTGLPAITSCSANYTFTNAAGNFSVESVGYNATTGKYENGGGKYYTLVNAGWYLVDKYSETYCNTSTNRMLYHNVAECTANSYCPGYKSIPLCSTGTHNDEMGRFACSDLGNGYNYSPAKSGAETACYLTTSNSKFVAAAGAAESACTAGGWCPGGVRVNYGSTGGRNTCPTKYPLSSASSNSELDCYVTTAAGKYVATVGAGQVNCAGTGYYCPGGTNVYSGAYGSRLTTGGRTQCPAGYRDLVATASTTKEAQCTMNVAGGKYVAKANESAASGTCAAGYAKAAHSVTYGNTSSCAACTGATYAASTGQASCTTCPTAKTYASAVKSYGYWNNGKDGDHTISDGCYATMTGTLSNGSLTEHGCYLGTDGDYGNGGGKRCYVHQGNLKCNAGYYASTLSNGYVWNNTRAGLLGNTCVGVGAGYYSAANILTRNQCPTGLTTIGYGAGADEVTDCGRILHFGNDKLYLRSGKKTTPSLNVKIGDTTYYGNMTAGTGKGKLRLKSGTTTYSVHDDSM